jgi:IclR family pca regulon transcriptional regulator
LPENEARILIEKSSLTSFTPRTKTDPAELMEELARVRADGFAVIDQELELGLCSIAVPLRNDRGTVVAAINIGAPAASIASDRIVDLYLKPLRAIADALKPLLR